MSKLMFVPKKINVGFQERRDTYSKKLAYVTYFDEKGKLRKETSWNGWRDHKIDNEIFENEPLEGFVLNKKAGGHKSGWNFRQSYVRVYDPRGFEIEITVANLLYILENANSIKGKALEGEFVYGWDGADLVLIPTSAVDYPEIKSYNNIIHNNLRPKPKDLIVGATYYTKYDTERVYLGKFHKFDEDTGEQEKGKFFYFYNPSIETPYHYSRFEIVKSLPKTILGVLNEECVDNFAEIMDELSHNANFSPIDLSKTIYQPYTLEMFKKHLESDNWYNYTYSEDGKLRYRSYTVKQWRSENIENIKTYTEPKKEGRKYLVNSHYHLKPLNFETFEEAFESLKPHRRTVYLKNGKEEIVASGW